MKKHDIYLVEDHAFMRETLCTFLNTMSEIRICGTAGNAEDALEDLSECTADLVLVDVSLPDMNGIELAGRIRDNFKGLPCVMLSGHHDSSYVTRAMDAGARGYILKGDPMEIAEAILRVLGGEVYVSRGIQPGAIR